MKEGRASRTAEMVCEGRAIAHGQRYLASFSDPTALVLLPDEVRTRVEGFLAGAKTGGPAEAVRWRFRERQAQVMALRTVAIDEAVRQAGHGQVVTLGAGLDGRAWRMPELKDAVVFEVDHPDSQRDKRARVASLHPTAKDIRFVSVDFTRDSLDACLSAAGHEPTSPTTWIWEGVVMYLNAEQVEATLAVIAQRSAPRSRLVVLYHAPSVVLRLVGLVVRRLGEPLRSSYTPDTIRAVLLRYGFEVARDENPPMLADRFGPHLKKAMRPITHLRVATADRRTT